MTIKLYFIILTLIMGSHLALAQHNILTGTVVDENNEELIGATVFLAELGLGDDTDTSGSFNIHNIPDGTHKVIVSFSDVYV